MNPQSAPPQGGIPEQAAAPPDPTDNPHIPVQGLNGEIPMVVGGLSKYPNIQFANHVDFAHVNPHLLAAMQKIAEKQGVHITVTSGYRSGVHEMAQGPALAAGGTHTTGLSVDAYISGHPIGEVIPPDVWAKVGIRAGAAAGFYNKSASPEHLTFVGHPVKGGKK